MPKPSTPALFPTIVSPFTPLSRSAAIKFSGIPQSPKPPAAIVMSSCSNPRQGRGRIRENFAHRATLRAARAGSKCGGRAQTLGALKTEPRNQEIKSALPRDSHAFA